MRAVWLRRHHRVAEIGGLADHHVERHFAEKWHAQPFGLFAGAAMAEDFRALAALWADEIAHVFDHAEDRHITLRNMARPFRASISARSCGVDTITAPASGICWASVSCASPVPGGMSTIITSGSPQSTSRSNLGQADITIGPRQIIGVSSDQKADRHHFEAVGVMGFSACRRWSRAFRQGEQLGHRGPINVGIENRHLQPERVQP